MAQAMASMAGLRGSTQAVLEGSLQLSGSNRLSSPTMSTRVAVGRSGTTAVRAQQAEGEAAASRRAVLGLVAAGLAGGSFVQAVLADVKSIKVGPPPPPSGGLSKLYFLPYSLRWGYLDFTNIQLYHIRVAISAAASRVEVSIGRF